MAYLLYRCDCGRVLYSKETSKTRKCTCGKTIKVKERRILGKFDDIRDAIEATQNMQEQIYGGTCFKRADEL